MAFGNFCHIVPNFHKIYTKKAKNPMISWQKVKYPAILCSTCGEDGLGRRCCKMVYATSATE